MKRESNRWRRALELAGADGTISLGSIGHDRLVFSDERVAEIAAALLDAARREVARCSRAPGAYQDAVEIVRVLRVAVGLASAERKALAEDGGAA